MKVSSWQICVWACVVAIVVGCTGCQKHLQGKYVCTQDVDTSGAMGLDPAAKPDPTKKPTLEFSRDGTFYASNVFPGTQIQGTYSILGDSLKLSLVGGLEVHSGTIHGNMIDTDFAVTQYKPTVSNIGGYPIQDFKTDTIKLSFRKQ